MGNKISAPGLHCFFFFSDFCYGSLTNLAQFHQQCTIFQITCTSDRLICHEVGQFLIVKCVNCVLYISHFQICNVDNRMSMFARVLQLLTDACPLPIGWWRGHFHP